MGRTSGAVARACARSERLAASEKTCSAINACRAYDHAARRAHYANASAGLTFTLIEKESGHRSGDPASVFPTPGLVEIATITAWGLAGQPMECGRERARLAEADIKRNGGDGQLTLRQ